MRLFPYFLVKRSQRPARPPSTKSRDDRAGECERCLSGLLFFDHHHYCFDGCFSRDILIAQRNASPAMALRQRL
jgi:hypothetical protein